MASKGTLITLTIIGASLVAVWLFSRMYTQASLDASWSVCRALQARVDGVRSPQGEYPKLESLAGYQYDGHYQTILALNPGGARRGGISLVSGARDSVTTRLQRGIHCLAPCCMA